MDQCRDGANAIDSTRNSILLQNGSWIDLPIEKDPQPSPESAAEAVPALIGALAAKDRRIRQDAIRELGRIGPESADTVPLLVEVLEDRGKTEYARLGAAEALGFLRLSEGGAVPALIGALGHEEEDVRRAAAWALGRIGPQAAEAVPALIQALGDEGQGVGSSAARALGRIGPEAAEAVPALIQALEDEDSDVRSSAALALGQIGAGAAEAVPALIQALEDEDWDLCSSAARALTSITGRRHGTDTARWREWWETQR